MNTMALYHLRSGGKCLRGRLALAEGESLGLLQRQVLPWALACELLHNATLIHDDIQDNDPIRRGQMSVWKKFGTAQAINTGDLLIFRAFNLTAQLEQPALTSLLADVSERLVQGQVDESLPTTTKNQSYWESYVDMVRHKTGALFELPIHGVHIMAHGHFANHFREAWLNLGVCYQVIDDIRDYLGKKQSGQKQKDLEERKANALIARLSQYPEFAESIEDYLHSPKPRAYQEAVALIHRGLETHRVIEDLQAYAEHLLIEFKKQTPLQTQQIILRYIQTAID
jgi:geranylgeranyl diphosphate synthase type I